MSRVFHVKALVGPIGPSRFLREGPFAALLGPGSGELGWYENIAALSLGRSLSSHFNVEMTFCFVWTMATWHLALAPPRPVPPAGPLNTGRQELWCNIVAVCARPGRAHNTASLYSPHQQPGDNYFALCCFVSSQMAIVVNHCWWWSLGKLLAQARYLTRSSRARGRVSPRAQPVFSAVKLRVEAG